MISNPLLIVLMVCSPSDDEGEGQDREIASQMYQLTEGLPFYGSIECLRCPLDASIKQKLTAYFTYPIDLMIKETNNFYQHFMAFAQLELLEIEATIAFFDEYLPERTRAGHARYRSHIQQRNLLLLQRAEKQGEWDAKTARLEAKAKEIPPSVSFSLKMIRKYRRLPKSQEELEALQQITYLEDVKDETIYFYFNGEQMHFPVTLKTRKGLTAHFSRRLTREMESLKLIHALRMARICGHLEKMEGKIRSTDALTEEPFDEEAMEVITLSLQRYKDSQAIYTRLRELEEIYHGKRLKTFQARLDHVPMIVLVARCILAVRAKEERLKENSPN